MIAAPRLSTPPPGQERRWCHVAGCTAEPRYGYHVFLNGKRADEIHVCAAHCAQGEAAWRARSGRDVKLPDPDAAVPDRWGKDLFASKREVCSVPLPRPDHPSSVGSRVAGPGARDGLAIRNNPDQPGGAKR